LQTGKQTTIQTDKSEDINSVLGGTEGIIEYSVSCHDNNAVLFT